MNSLIKKNRSLELLSEINRIIPTFQANVISTKIGNIVVDCYSFWYCNERANTEPFLLERLNTLDGWTNSFFLRHNEISSQCGLDARNVSKNKEIDYT